MEGMIFI